MSQFKKVEVVAHTVSNWEKAKKFYTEVLEWPLIFASEEAGWIEFGRENETHISINRWNGPGSAPVKSKAVIAVFTVEDAHKTHDWLVAKGVKCDEVVHIPGMVTYGTFYDPEGNALQFASAG